MSEHRKRILVDFDGVLHSYTSGWQGARVIPDPPVPGAIEWLCRVLADFDVAIYSSRSHQWGGRRAMKRWLREHARQFFLREQETPDVLDTLEYWRFIKYTTSMDPWDIECEEAARHLVRRIEWPRVKVSAHLQIDDRAVTFGGTFPSVELIRKFQPWTRRHA